MKDAKEAAGEIRKVLKATWPGHKFSVRVRRFSCNASVDITWWDGPTAREVGEATDYLKGWDNGYENSYIGLIRHVSHEAMQAAAEAAGQFYGLPAPQVKSHGDHPYVEDIRTVQGRTCKEALGDLVHRAALTTSIYGVELTKAFAGAFPC